MRIRIESNGLQTRVFDIDSGEDISENITGISWRTTPKGAEAKLLISNVALDARAIVRKADVELPSRLDRTAAVQTTFGVPADYADDGEEDALEGEYLALPSGERTLDEFSVVGESGSGDSDEEDEE